ncbi:hypothetical protein [Bradyrhizobium sp. USDA 10063]
MAAGLEQSLELLESLHFSADELNWLEKSGRFSARLIDYLANFRFSGERETRRLHRAEGSRSQHFG